MGTNSLNSLLDNKLLTARIQTCAWLSIVNTSEHLKTQLKGSEMFAIHSLGIFYLNLRPGNGVCTVLQFVVEGICASNHRRMVCPSQLLLLSLFPLAAFLLSQLEM